MACSRDLFRGIMISMEDLRDVHYDAFISYKHSELDSFVAENLHKKLEAFKLPKSVLPKVKNGKTRIERVFHDVDELNLSENLADPINNALRNSDYLIAVCTPRYPGSEWCIKEIEVFLQTHDHEHVLVVLAEDEPCNSFPEILTYEEYTRIDENGKKITERRELEPLAADTRGADKKEIMRAIDNAVIKLCSVIFDLNYDDLKQRHRERKIKQMISVFSVAALMILLFAVSATAMLVRISSQNTTIQQQYAVLQDKYAGTMADASRRLLGEGRRKDAVYAARSVLPDDPALPRNSSAVSSLYSALAVYGTGDRYEPVCVYDTGREIVTYEISCDGRYVMLYDTVSVSVFDRDTAELIISVKTGDDGHSGDMTGGVFCGPDGFIVCSDGGTEYISLKGMGRKRLTDIDPYSSFFSSADGIITIAYSDDVLKGIDPSGNIAYVIDLAQEFDAGFMDVQDVSFDNGNFCISLISGNEYHILAADEQHGRKFTSFSGEGNVMIRTAIDGDILYYSIFDYSDYGSDMWTTVFAFNRLSGQKLWEKDIPDMNCMDICTSEEYVFIYDKYSAVVLDKKTGRPQNVITTENPVVNGWIEGESLFLAKSNGEFFICDEALKYAAVDDIRKVQSKLVSEYTYNGDRYLLFDGAAYLVRYSREDKLYIEDLEDIYNVKRYDASDATEAFTQEDMTAVDKAFFSDDEKYIYAQFHDHSCGIYDALTMELIASPDIPESYLCRLEYSDIAECYILSSFYKSYFLDDEFNVFCITDCIAGSEKDRFIMVDSSNDAVSVPYVSYEQLLKTADAYLDGYIPPERIRQKYNIMAQEDR